MQTFNHHQLQTINQAAAMAEELVSNHYKLAASEWLGRKYDIKTQSDLSPNEIIEGPFAQIIRYKGQRPDSALTSCTYDFYKICLQDHAILSVLQQAPQIQLLPFSLYIITHELIHIVRFTKFLQSFVASQDERQVEEARVHQRTHDILENVQVPGLPDVLKYYRAWHRYHETLRTA
jgi:hypothetical protein